MPIGAVDPVLTFGALLGACVWIGGFVGLVVVCVARRQLDRPSQVAFFRALGRSYLPVGSVALALRCAAALRATIGLLSLGLLALASILAGGG